MAFLKTSRMSLQERLALHLKSEVALLAQGYEGEPGVLQKVGKRFIRVGAEYFVPAALQEIVLLGAPRSAAGTQVNVRTFHAGTFRAALIRTGTDFLELLVMREEEEEELTLLIPLTQVIGIERL